MTTLACAPWIFAVAMLGACSTPPPNEPANISDQPADAGSGADEEPVPVALGIDDPAALEAALRAAGVASVQALDAEDGSTLAFELLFEQPLDHEDPDSRTFLQRAVLVHRDTRAPMVLNPTGYMLFPGYEQLPEELTSLLGGNQLQVEHRFFGASFPDDLVADDWRHLTVAQAAADHHAIVTALRRVYAAPWLETGHSKGGMTSVFHHVLYPDDVDAVVAYVAPISFSVNDRRGRPFLETLGDPACRDAIRAFQTNAAGQRQEILDLMQTASPTLTRPQLDAYFAMTVGSLEWGYWMYAEGCADAELYAPNAEPAVTAYQLSLDDDLAGIPVDPATSFLAYSYQVAHEIGQPDQWSAHVDSLLQGADASPFAAYLDFVLPFAPPAYDDAVMVDIQERVRTRDDIVFVYGGFDPWTSAAFDPGTAGNVSVVAAGMNHGALLLDLDPAARSAALDVVLGQTELDVAAELFTMSHVGEARWRAYREVARNHFARRAGLRP